MSYVVLARKWRPMKFEDVISQDHVSTTLKNAISNDRLASAYLFSGPRGVGKTTTARILAKAVNCEQGPTPTPCNECHSCTEITESRSLDVFEIDGASNRGIDEVRNLRENLKYAASKGKHKIYIIDEVHMLTTEAFNALLKTLEEPPARVLFIFATTEFHKVPATILSRCQRYDFRRIPPNEIAEQLKKICESESVKIEEEALFLIARKADGSLRDSQSLLDQVISFCGNKINLDDLTSLLGVIDQDFFFKCSEAISEKEVDTGLDLVEQVFNQGYDIAEFLNGLAEHFRNMLVVKATHKMNLLEGLESYKQRYQDSVKTFSETDLLRLIQIASDAANLVKRSANPKLNLEMSVIKMIKMDKSLDLKTLLSNLSNPTTDTETKPPESSPRSPDAGASASPVTTTTTEQTKMVSIKEIKPQIKETLAAEAPGNGPAPQQTASPLNEGEVVSLEKIKTDWPRIIDEVKKQKIHLGSFLNEGYPTALRAETLEISFAKESNFHIRTIEDNKKIVQKIIMQVTQFNLAIKCHKNESDEFRQVLTQQRSTSTAPETLIKPVKIAEEEALDIPIVKKVIEIFDGEVVKSNA